MFPWESPGGSPRRGRRWLEQTSQQSSLDKPDHGPSQGGPLDGPNETAASQGGSLEKEDIRQRGMQDKRQPSINQDTSSAVGQQAADRQIPATGEPQPQEQFKSPQYPAQANTIAPTAPASIPPPESTSSQPGPPQPQQPYGTQPIPPQANIPPQVGAQPYTPQSYHPQYQPSPFASSAIQNLPQSLPYQPQYQSPAGFQPPPQTPQPSFQIVQPSPHIPQPSSLERLQMTKLKAESEVQQSRLMVASEHQEQHKTRLEEEVKELMKRVQEMEGIKQRKELDAASKVSELEGKVRGLKSVICLITRYMMMCVIT